MNMYLFSNHGKCGGECKGYPVCNFRHGWCTQGPASYPFVGHTGSPEGCSLGFLAAAKGLTSNLGHGLGAASSPRLAESFAGISETWLRSEERGQAWEGRAASAEGAGVARVTRTRSHIARPPSPSCSAARVAAGSEAHVRQSPSSCRGQQYLTDSGPGALPPCGGRVPAASWGGQKPPHPGRGCREVRPPPEGPALLSTVSRVPFSLPLRKELLRGNRHDNLERGHGAPRGDGGPRVR